MSQDKQGFSLEHQIKLYMLLQEISRSTASIPHTLEDSTSLISSIHVDAIMLLAEINNPEEFAKIAKQALATPQAEPASQPATGLRYTVESANSSSATWNVWDNVANKLVIHTGHDYKLAEDKALNMNIAADLYPVKYTTYQRANGNWYVRDMHAGSCLYPGSNGYATEQEAEQAATALNAGSTEAGG